VRAHRLAGVGRLVAVVGLILGAIPTGNGAATETTEPDRELLKSLLAQDDYEATRADLLRALQRPGGLPCWWLGAFADERNDRIREHAVRALSDAGCSHFDSYRPFTNDSSTWVTDALLRAVERRQIAGAVPFLISRLIDGRRIVSAEGWWTIGDSAHRALKVVTCQSFHFDLRGSAPEQAAAMAAWSRWYEAHRDEPRELWVSSGIALARDYIGSDDPARRREGLDLLTWIGAPALPALRAAFQRGPQDLKASLACASEEPPRVTEDVTCVLLVLNGSGRRVALAPAPGDPQVRLTRHGEERDPSRGEPTKGQGKGLRGTGLAQEPLPPSPRPVPPAADIAPRIIDLAPGEVLKREVRVGPVMTAGHYEVRVTLADLASAIEPQPLPTIEAATVLRFEQ